MAEVATRHPGKEFSPQHGEGNIISETGIILSSEDIEEMISNEIASIHERMHRADTTSVCRSLFRAHGLSETTVALQLNYMIATGKVSKGLYRGKENLELRDENKEIEFTESKKSKMSDDEEKLIECRSRILEEASRHKDTADESNDEKNEADESGESEIFSMSPGKNAAENETRERLEILESKVNQIMNRIDFTDRK